VIETPDEAVEDEAGEELDAGESAQDDSSQDESDSLIDIDILASASAVGLSGTDASDLEASTPDTESSEAGEAQDNQTLDDSGMFSDDSGILDAGDTGVDLDDAPASDLDDSIGGLHDSGQASGLGEAASLDDVASDEKIEDALDEADEAEDEPLSEGLNQEAELQESERQLLLTEQEQSQAVTGYKRSKLVTLLLVVLISAAVGFGGWYGYEYFSNKTVASDTQTRQNPDNIDTSTTDPVVNEPDEDAPVNPPKQRTGPAGIPDIAPPKQRSGFVGIPDIPAKTPPADEPDNGTAEDVDPETQTAPGPVPIPDITDRPADTPSDTPSTDTSLAPDPFEDVDASVFDAPQAVPSPAEPGEDVTETPTEPEPVSQADPRADTAVVVAVEGDPAPDTASSVEPAPTEITTTDTTDVDTAAAPKPEADPTPAVSPDTDTTSSDPDESQLDVLAGVIDANNKPGVGVNEQAARAGAKRIVYLVDASGSLVDSFPRVLNELNSAIDQLQEDQAFTAIFFGAEGVTEVPPTGLKWADAQTKRNTRDWINPDRGNVTAWGRGDVMQALKRATGYGADEIVVLSDNLLGSRPSKAKIETLMDEIATITDGKVAKINVIQFFTRDPKQVLKTIAERFNGTYSLVPSIAEPSAEHPGEDPLVYP